MKRNEYYEAVSGFLFVLLILLSCLYCIEDKMITLTLLMSCCVFSLITYFSEREMADPFYYAKIKCGCMLVCLLMMINLIFEIDLCVVMIFLLEMLLITVSKQMY